MSKKKKNIYSALQQEVPTVARQVQDAKPDGNLTMDAFVNTLARIGFGTSSLLEGTEYANTRLTRDFQLIVTLYRSNWIVRKVIDVAAEDMVKNWYQITSEMDPKHIDQLQRLERTTKTRANMLQALKWGRLFGGGAAIMIIDGHDDHLEEPLDLDEVMPGSYKGLIPLDRWSGISPNGDLIDDVDSPDFGLPASYSVNLNGGGHFDIHSSRVLRFIGRDLPLWEKMAEQYWGISEVEVVYDELKKRDNVSFSIANLIFLANIRVLTLPGLAEALGSMNASAQQNLFRMLTAQNQLMSNMGMMVIPKDGEFNTHQYSFAGLNDIYESFMLDVSGAAEYPVTKLFGRSPAGMNATGESDLQNYYDSIGQRQEAQLRPNHEKLLPVMAMSLWGQVPDDFDFKYPSAATVPMDKLAEVAGKKTSSIVEVFSAGIVSQRTALKELRQLEDETGMFSNITDEDIAAADDKPQGMGEMGGGGIPGMEQAGGEGMEPSKPPAAGEQDGTAQQSGSRVGKLLQEMKGLLQSWRQGNRAPVSSLKEQLAESKQKREADERAEELQKSLREDMKRITGDAAPNGWIGVDLDGTLAEEEKGNYDPYRIGPPVPKMVDRVKRKLAKGKTVKIMTARVAHLEGEALGKVEALIKNWCVKHIGQELPVTNEKDPGMTELWDNRAVRVESNTGEVENPQKVLDSLIADMKSYIDQNK